MLDWDLPRNTSGVHALIQLASERGLSPGACLAGTALLPEHVTCPDAEITARQELRVVRNVMRHCGDEPGLGVEAGRRYRLSPYGPWGLALLASGTVREMLEVAVKYVELAVVFGRLSFEQRPSEARLVFDGTDVPDDVRPFLAERLLAGIQATGRELFSTGLSAQRVMFRHRAPADVSRYREILGVEPVFDAAHDLLAFDGAQLDLPLPQASESARDTCGRACRDLLTSRRTRAGVSGAVRDLLVRDPGELPDQTAVAAELFVSPRTLSRRLSEEGTSFRALLDEVRQALAEELLSHTGMTSEQVAARLGYAEAASFIRAFRRWNGCPPREFRLRSVSG
ncbi:AraC family transcriptional regulator [Nocardia mexicana]|uniref:AraC family transcriptional regulator n=1 Tax=Nocardia mexicana TaxID=279262 RepID=A0A370GRW3_9NOCA|nr:AraC family transcriptional regulator [Nocardia mexicana]RDI46442.1 AraC family transcriptional regulator [Nocardia mexicana]